MEINIPSEYDPLQVVLLHAPHKELDRLTPGNCQDYLFDACPFPSGALKEHEEFAALLRNENVRLLYFRDLLEEVLKVPRTRKDVIYRTCYMENQPALASSLLEVYDFRQLTNILIDGLSPKEFHEATGEDFIGHPASFLIRPLPNLCFTRDLGAIIGSGIVSCNMRYDARAREAMLLSIIFDQHPDFSSAGKLFGFRQEEERPYFLEGGDILVLSPHVVLVGHSERTCPEAIRKLAQALFRHTEVDRVYEVKVPKNRRYMHLDTVFSVIDKDLVVMHPEGTTFVVEITRYVPKAVEDGPTAERQRAGVSILEILQDELGFFDLVLTAGNDEAFIDREQMQDATNVLAIGPRKVVSFARNQRTNAALKEKGVAVLEFDGAEIVRGCGGPRCMTLPLLRKQP